MEQSKTQQKSTVDKELEEFMKQASDILYKRTSQEVGSRVNEGGKDPKKTSDGSFTKHLQSSGMYRFNGLNTVADKERVINGSKDWMQKIV
jgi:hypothetical protein